MEAITVAGVVILTVLGGSFVAIDQDFIPAGFIGIDNLDLHEPIGCRYTMDMDALKDEYPLVWDEVSRIPHINELKCGIYETKYSVNMVMNDYQDILQNHGYSMIKKGNDYFSYPIMFKGEKVGYMDIQYYFIGFQKLGTAVGILISDEIPGYDTFVLYTTGYAGHYQDIDNYINNN